MDEQRLADRVADQPGDDVHGVLGGAKLDQPRRGAAWPRQLEVVSSEPHDEDLCLHRALDVERASGSVHAPMVARSAPGGTGRVRDAIRHLPDASRRGRSARSRGLP